MKTTGSKGSASQSARTPVESPDSLINTSTAKVLDLISEGEIVGLVNGLESVFLAETPAVRGGLVNFSGFSAQWRNGTQDQTYIPAFPESQSETAIGSVVKQAVPFIRAISNNQLSAVRIRLSMPRSVSVDPKTGDSNGTLTQYKIELATDGGAYVTVVDGKFNGKTAQGYQRSHRIDLPPSSSGWFLKLTRITPDSDSQNLINEFSVASITEVIDAKMKYVNSAVVATQFDAKQFDSIPSRAFHMRGMIIRVPSNYNPETRIYSGTWDGTFKRAYSNNPAWIYYDLLLNPRYGLGKRIIAAQIDKWELYRISQYCDQLVSDGFGGKEPRYTCNLYLQSRAEALRVLQDIASIFRGMAYWGASQAFLTADMPDDAYKTFTNSNVVDGKFTYKGTALKSRYNVALVTWNDMNDFGRQKVEYVEDQDLISLYGRIQKIELTATGCTSRGQAQRNGRWALLTNNLENEIVSFGGGLECAYLRPGMIIRVADKNRAGPRQGGRISASALRSITTDQIGQVAIGDTVALPTPEGGSVTRVITGINGNVVSWSTALDAPSPVGAVWGFESATLAMQKFRVVGVTEKAAGITYAVTATKHVEQKYEGIENGVKIAPTPISQIPSSLQPAPQNVRLTSDWGIEQTMAVTTMTIAWDPAPGAVDYAIQWRKDDNTWITTGRTSSTEIDVKGIYAGRYIAQVQAFNVWGQSSPWASSPLTEINGKEGEPPVLASFTATGIVFGIRLDWGFPPDATDTLRTEIDYGPNRTELQKLGDFAYPINTHTLMGLRAGQQFSFRARLVDRSGNFGPWSDFIEGASSADADEILDYLTGQITKSELGQELLSEIGQIGGSGPGSVNERLDQVRADLGEQITDVNNTVTEVKNELQEQIDNIADLSDSMPYKPTETYTAGQGVLGADGIIYQAVKAVPVQTPPPNAEFWLNVGAAVVTANALAARVTTSEQKISDVEGVNTAQSNLINGLRVDVDSKASGSAVQSLTTRVTTAENTLSSQGTAITGLNNSLTVTNGNVTAAQNAANAANTLAGGKGKVIVQSAAPAAADQLAQNLWIDTTGNANTPKRWTGSAWAAVTDKAATDAAAAAASALAQVATKAEASTVQALSNTVTQHGTDISAAGNAITTINANLTSVGGENLLYNPSFERATNGIADGFVADGTAPSTRTQVASTLDPSGKAQRTEMTGLSSSVYSGIATAVAKRPAVSAGQTITVSSYMRATVSLLMVTYIQFVNASGAVVTTPAPATVLSDGTWQRLTLTATAPAGTVSANVLFRVLSGSQTGGFWEIDRAQVELSSIATGWKDNGLVSGSDLSAQAAATTALTARVTQTETGLTSVSGQITTLNNTIGTSGGENFLPNSSFETWGSLGDRPVFWQMDYNSGAPPVLSQVDSPLPSSVKALRIAKAALPNADYIGMYFFPNDGPRPKVVAGQWYTLSAYVRMSPVAGTRFAMYIVFVNEAGTVISAPQLAETPITGSFTRLSLTAQCPAAATRVQLYPARMFNRSGAAVDAWVEVDNIQFQEGTAATAYTPSVEALDTRLKATSTVVDSLSSTVSQQGTDLTSVSGRTTSLENSVSSIQGSLGASGLDAAPGASWTFDSTVQGWASTNSTLSLPSPGIMRQTATANDPSTQVGGLSVNGALYTKIRASVTRRAGSPTGDWDGTVYYTTSAHGVSASYAKTLPNPALAVGASAILEWDMAALTVGGTDWTSSTITLIRIDLGSANGSIFDIDWVAIGRPGIAASSSALDALTNRVTVAEGTVTSTAARTTTLESTVNNGSTGLATKASATALNNLQTTVTSQGNTITSQGQSITQLNSTVGNQSAQLSQQATTIADTAGKVSSSYVVKMGITSDGRYYTAGFGVGLSNAGGVTQSRFIVNADQFSVLNGSADMNNGGTVTSPFIIENGQVFMSDAVIKRATIQNGIIGGGLSSSQYTNAGEPVLTQDFASGNLIIRNAARSGTYTVFNRDGVIVVVDNVLRVRMGVW